MDLMMYRQGDKFVSRQEVAEIDTPHAQILRNPDEMFCEPNQDQDCKEIFRRWLRKQVKGGTRKN